MAQQDEAARRLMTIPGIGPINTTALVAALGDGQAFARGRDMAARLGLTPRQQTTGGKPRLLGIGKRGNRYLRKNLIHAARAPLPARRLEGGPIEHLLLKDIGSMEEYLRVVREDGLTVKRQLGNLEQ